MAINQEETKIEEKKEEKAIQEEKSPDVWYRVRPRHSMDFDAGSGEFNILVELPGVSKDNVSLKVLSDLYDLKGHREHTLFTLTEYFPYIVDVDSIEAMYDHGLLKIKGKFKNRLSEAVDISIS